MSRSATLATHNGMTTCLETFEKERFCSCPHRHGEATEKLEARNETHGSTKTSISCETSSNFNTLKHAEKNMFCSFPHRHGDTTGKPETRDETRGSTKTSISQLRTVANVNATSSEHTLNPQTPRVKREPLLRIRENLLNNWKKWSEDCSLLLENTATKYPNNKFRKLVNEKSSNISSKLFNLITPLKPQATK